MSVDTCNLRSSFLLRFVLAKNVELLVLEGNLFDKVQIGAHLVDHKANEVEKRVELGAQGVGGLDVDGGEICSVSFGQPDSLGYQVVDVRLKGSTEREVGFQNVTQSKHEDALLAREDQYDRVDNLLVRVVPRGEGGKEVHQLQRFNSAEQLFVDLGEENAGKNEDLVDGLIRSQLPEVGEVHEDQKLADQNYKSVLQVFADKVEVKERVLELIISTGLELTEEEEGAN